MINGGGTDDDDVVRVVADVVGVKVTAESVLLDCELGLSFCVAVDIVSDDCETALDGTVKSFISTSPFSIFVSLFGNLLLNCRTFLCRNNGFRTEVWSGNKRKI
jgi:hypothetical protein